MYIRTQQTPQNLKALKKIASLHGQTDSQIVRAQQLKKAPCYVWDHAAWVRDYFAQPHRLFANEGEMRAYYVHEAPTLWWRMADHHQGLFTVQRREKRKGGMIVHRIYHIDSTPGVINDPGEPLLRCIVIEPTAVYPHAMDFRERHLFFVQPSPAPGMIVALRLEMAKQPGVGQVSTGETVEVPDDDEVVSVARYELSAFFDYYLRLTQQLAAGR